MHRKFGLLAHATKIVFGQQVRSPSRPRWHPPSHRGCRRAFVSCAIPWQESQHTYDAAL